MKVLNLLICLLVSACSLSAQLRDPPLQVDPPYWQRFHYAKPSIRLSYYGHNYFRPGLSAGLEQPIWEKRKEKEKRNGKVKVKHRFWFLAADISAWYHPNSYSAQSLRAGALWRKVRNRGGKFEAALYLGVVNRFNNGRTYTVREDGTVKTRFWDSRIYFMPTVALGFGKDHLYAKKSRPIAWHIRPTVSLWMPYNTIATPAFGLETGVSIYLKDFQPLRIFSRK